ncbi:MAG: thioredoxin reductase [Thermoleophilaceae bacterium]|nr:thioredoxin reductase [Thermoleophilaceae bacterium]
MSDGVAEEQKIENVIIVGGGPAGYTAALYTSRADLHPLVVEGFLWGGLLQQTTDVENYPGFPQGVMGPEMMQSFRDQAERFGTRFVSEDATRVELSRDGGPHRVYVGDEEYLTRTVILSMGAQHRKLGVPGEEELSARGISYCATCDAAFFREKKIAVVGGGDSAMEEAIFLSKFGSTVKVIHRRDEFRASQVMLNRAKEIENIEFVTPYAVEEFHEGEGALEKVELRHSETGERLELEVDGTFIAVGHVPTSQLVEGQVEVDENGYVVTDGKSTRTGVAGVFAAGDLVDHTYRQAITAAGSGCQAALDAEWFLRDTISPEAHWSTPDEIEAEAERVKSGEHPILPSRVPL